MFFLPNKEEQMKVIFVAYIFHRTTMYWFNAAQLDPTFDKIFHF